MSAITNILPDKSSYLNLIGCKNKPDDLSFKRSQPSVFFSLEEGQFFDDDGFVFNRNITQYCRNDINWREFGKYLKERFPDISNVDIYDFGCSTGEEPYTLALLLQKVYGNSDFKIQASDIDEFNIKHNLRTQK